MLDVAAKFFHGVVKSIVPSDNLLRNSIRYSNYWTNNFEKQFDLDTYYWKFVFCVLWYYLPTLPAPPEWRAKVGPSRCCTRTASQVRDADRPARIGFLCV